MPELSGPILPLELVSWLWLIPFFPLLGAIANAVYSSGFHTLLANALRARFADEGEKVARRRRIVAPARVASNIATWSFVASLVVCLVAVGVLLQLPSERRRLFEHLWLFVRAGAFDASADLVLDPLSSAVIVLITLLASVVTPYAAVRAVNAEPLEAKDRDGRTPLLFASLGAFVGCLVLVALADNALFLLFAWGGAALAGTAMVGFGGMDGAKALAVGTRAFVVQRVGDALLLLGFGLVFWGLAGAWDLSGAFQAELSPRVAAVAVTTADPKAPWNEATKAGEGALKGRGYVTVTALPDSLVYMDDSRVPILDAKGMPARTPMVRHEVPGGAHSFRIAPDDSFRGGDREAKVPYFLEGGVLPNYSIQRTAFGADHEVALTLLGPTLRFSELENELLLADVHGVHPGREGLVLRRLGGRGIAESLQLLSVACLLILLGVGAKSALVPVHAWLVDASESEPSVAALLEGAGLLVAGAYLVARLGFLFSVSHVASLALLVVGIFTAVFGAVAAARSFDLSRVLAYSTVSQAGLAFVALSADAYSAAVFLLGTHAIVKTCLVLSAGAVFEGARAMAHEGKSARDLRNLGGLARVMPRVSSAYRVGCLALTAVPVPFLAGFWSMGDVMERTFSSTALPPSVGKVAYLLLVGAAGLTSFGMWRSYYLVFGGKAAHPKALPKVKDADPGSARVIMLLAFLSSVTGVVFGASGRSIGGAADSLLDAWLAPVFSSALSHAGFVSVAVRFGIFGLFVAIAYGAWAAARQRYGDGRRTDWAAREPMLGHSPGGRR